MANDSIDFHRRCSSLGLDPDIRVGRLTFVANIADRMKRIRAVMFLCDCGKFCRVGLTTILYWEKGESELPWECPKCALWTKRNRIAMVINGQKRYTKHQKIKNRLMLKRKREEERKREQGIPIKGRYKKDFKSEYRAWTNMRCNRNPVVKKWQGENGFERFLADMGPKPVPEAFLTRKDLSRPHGPDNSIWLVKTKTPQVP